MDSSSAERMGWLVWLVLWVSIAICLAFVLVQARRWRAGRPVPTNWLRALLCLPGRYLVDVHAVVARHTATSWMHATLAGGYLASLLLWALFPIVPALGWTVLQGGALALCTAGLVLLAGRRLGASKAGSARPQRLSGGAFNALPLAFVAYLAASVVLVAQRGVGTQSGVSAGLASIAAMLVLSAALVYLVALLMRSPLRHAVLGALYIAVHPKPWRFARGRGARVPDPSSAAHDGVVPGVGSLQAFDWKQLLSFDACVECGRCQAVCPAHAAGHALNPKALIQGLARSAHLRSDAYRGDGHGGPPQAQPDAQPALLGVPQSALWSCTTCAACVNACPMFIEHVDVVVDLRRHLTQVLGAVPGKLPIMLRELNDSGNSFGDAPDQRCAWATDLKLRFLRDVHEADVLVWLGDSAFELHGQQTLRALFQMLQMARVDFAVLGDEEQDCGHLSRRCGDEAAFVRLRRANLATLSKYRFKTIVTGDPHAFHTLRDEYPPAAWQVMHHTQYLAELIEEGRLAPTATGTGRVVYHDACYLGRHSQVYASPRALLQHAGCDSVEAPRAKENAFCCGAGGGQAWAGQPSETSIPLLRFKELAATGATQIAVACPNCKSMLQSVAGASIQVRDVAEILRESL